MEDPRIAVVADPPLSHAPLHLSGALTRSAHHVPIRPSHVSTTDSFWRRILLGGWGVAVVWAILFLVINVRVLLSPLHNSVVPIFTTASQRWILGTNLYDPIERFDWFRYSPLVAVLLIPFGSLPLGAGEVSWRLANGVIYLGALAWWLRAACPFALSRSQRAALFLLIIPLSGGSLNNGQCNPLVIGLLLATMASVATERWNLAGGCVALACFFKLYPLAIGLLLAVSYPRRFAPRFALALALGFFLPFWLQRSEYVLDQYVNWIQHLLTYDRGAMPLRLQYSDFRLVCRVWLWPIGPVLYLCVQLLTAAGIAVLCVAARWTAWLRRRQLSLLLGLGCCWMLLFGPATESCTHILLAPSLALALVENGRGDGSPSLRSLWLIGYAMMAVAGVSCWFPNGAILHDLAIQPLAVLLIFTGLVLQAGQRLWATWETEEVASILPLRTPVIQMSRCVLDLPETN